MTAALIMAAGTSSRMGTPKAFLEYRGRTFLDNIINTVRSAAITRILVAVSPIDDKIIKSIDLNVATVVFNTLPSNAGPLGSIHAAIASIINQTVESLLVWPIDQPHVSESTVLALVSAFGKTGGSIVVPSFQGTRGHPVIFGRTVFPELLSAPFANGARGVVRKNPGRVIQVPVLDPAITESIDTPEDYARLISSTKSLL